MSLDVYDTRVVFIILLTSCTETYEILWNSLEDTVVLSMGRVPIMFTKYTLVYSAATLGCQQVLVFGFNQYQSILENIIR